MKAIIEGKTYNTETATLIGEIGSETEFSSDFQWWKANLYKTKKGSFFMDGRGGASSPYGESIGGGTYAGSEGIRALTPQEALAYAEKDIDADVIAQHFADHIEEA